MPGPTRLRERLFEPAAGGRPLVADLDQVRFFDSAWLAALVGTAKRAAAVGQQFGQPPGGVPIAGVGAGAQLV